MELIITYIQRFIVLFTAITVHEFAHGFAAYKLGDPTAKNMGRLTLNPFSHFDPLGAICMVFFQFGWAKPVPINPMYFRHRKRDTAIVSLAGPLANILLTVVSTVVYMLCFCISAKYFPFNDGWYFVCQTLRNLALLNINFAVFNLIPIPPLDGSKILSTVLPTDAYMKLLEIERYGFPVLILLSIIDIRFDPFPFVKIYVSESGVLGRLLNVLITPLYNLWGVALDALWNLCIPIFWP